MANIRLLIVGAGGHGRSLAEAGILHSGIDFIGFLDDMVPTGEKRIGLPVLGAIAAIQEYRSAFDQVILAIGNNRVRESLMSRLAMDGFKFATIIHPHAFVSPSAVIGEGSAVMAGAVIGTEAIIGVGSIINCGAVVDHHAVVEEFGHLGVNTCMAGGTFLGRGAWMQAGSALGYGVKVPPWTTLRPCTAVDSSNKFEPTTAHQ